MKFTPISFQVLNIFFTITSTVFLLVSSFAQPETNKYFRHHTIADPLPGPQEWGTGGFSLADFDNDGDADLVIGNLGTNTQWKASVTEPISITYGDFYGNGTIAPILCYYNKGKSYPWFTKD